MATTSTVKYGDNEAASFMACHSRHTRLGMAHETAHTVQRLRALTAIEAFGTRISAQQVELELRSRGGRSCCNSDPRQRQEPHIHLRGAAL